MKRIFSVPGFRIVIIIAGLIAGCTKSDSNTKTATQAMFWIDIDPGCGGIAVTCNNISKAITGFNNSQPACGDKYAATFDLAPGTYTFTAKCNTKSWSGTIVVKEGTCNAFKLDNGGGGSTGGSSGAAGNPTVTSPSTTFISSQDYTVTNANANWSQQFTISVSTKMVLRFASQYQAQASIITSDQLNNFQSGKTFTGYATFNNQVGTNSVTLSAGTYYVAIRNTSTGINKWSVELDNAVSLPATDKAAFVDTYVSGAKTLTSGTRFWQPFTIQSGYRYFLDGCNVNCDVRIINANQLTAFQNGQTYQYYSAYYDASGAAPGFYELTLSPGDYYIVSLSTAVGSLVYTIERWKVN